MSPKPPRPRFILIVLAGICALACAYFLGRMQAPAASSGVASVAAASHGTDRDAANPSSTAPRMSSSSMPLPGRNVPLKKALPSLRERASGGDLAAANRLYRDLRFCGTLDGMGWFFSRVADELLDQKLDGSKAQDLDNYRVQLDAIEGRKQAMQRFHAFCEGVDRNMLDGQLPSLQKAAQLGDEQARACYLLRGPNYDPAGLVRHPEWLQSYRANIKSLIEAGVAAGDWRVVDIVRNAYQPGANGVLAGALGSDPALYYRYLKLYGLGAAPDRTREIEQQLASAAARITPEQRADAELWAQSRFSQAFGGSNSTDTTPQGWDACSFSTVPYDGE